MNLETKAKTLSNISDLKKLIAESPDNPDYYQSLGDYYTKINQYKFAIGSYRKAIKKYKAKIDCHPKRSLNYNQIGLCLDDLHLPHQAIRYYKKAISLKKNDSVYYYNLGIAENNANELRSGIAHFEYAIELNPYDSDYYDQLSVANNNQGNHDQAIHNSKIAIRLARSNGGHEDPEYYYNLACAENSVGEYSQGIKHIKHAIDLFPTDHVPVTYETFLHNLTLNNEDDDTGYRSNAKGSTQSTDSYDPNVDYMALLNGLIGLNSVKAMIKTFVHQVEMNEIRTGQRRHKRMHLVFEGNPGTGKTTVAKLFCKILYQKHIISKKRFTCVNATQMVRSRYGKSAEEVQKLVDRSIGGVLFIDEAYYLAHRTDGNSVCQDEAMDAFLTAIDQHNSDLVVIMAGYSDHMEHFLNKSNPGLQSRFPNNERITFPDYSSQECLQILDLFLERGRYTIKDTHTKQLLNRYMTRYINTKLNDSRNHFANARLVENIYDVLTNAFSNRLLGRYSMNQLRTLKRGNDPVVNEITSADVKRTFKCFSLKKFHRATTELNSLIGLDNVKTMLKSYVNQVEITKLRHGVANHGDMNLVFEGNPGTGKTTVAKLFCKVLYQKGIVKSDNYVCTSASMLESSVVGQSAANLRRAFYRAKDGVLFIDEAYALFNTKKKGSNVIPELVDDVTRYGNRVVVILAGYPKAMENLLHHGNAGLSSRFYQRVHFHDYSIKECLQILALDMHKDNLRLNSSYTKRKLERGFKKYIERAKTNRQARFANARTVNIFFKVLKASFADRLCDSASSTWLKTLKILHDRKLDTVTSGDVNNALKACDNMYRGSSRSVIGFR